MTAPSIDILPKHVVRLFLVDPMDHRVVDHQMHILVVLGHLKTALAAMAEAVTVIQIIGVIQMLLGTSLKT